MLGVVGIAAGLAVPTLFLREDTVLLLLLRVPAGNVSSQAEAESALAELCTFHDYLGIVVVVVASFAMVLFLLCFLLLNCLLILRLDLHGRCLGPD